MRKLFHSIIVSFAFILALLGLNQLLRPFYAPFLNQKLVLTINATAENHPDALANNVRIAHIQINGQDIPLNEIEILDGSEWFYDSEFDHLNAYNLTEPQILDIPLEGVRTLSIVFVKEVGSGIVRMSCKGICEETIDLYEDTDWNEVSYDYDTSGLVFVEKQLDILFILYGIVFILWFVLFVWVIPDFVEKKIYSYAAAGVLLTILSCAVCYDSLIIQYGGSGYAWEYVQTHLQVFLRTVALIFCIMSGIAGIINSVGISFMLTAMSVLILTVLSNIKLINRGTPLFPWDVSNAGAALSVAHGYEIGLSAEAAISALLIIVCSALLIFVNRKHLKEKVIVQRILFLPFLILTAFLIRGGFMYEDIEQGAEFKNYQSDQYYWNRGFLPSFFEYFHYTEKSERPAGYSKEAVQKTVSSVLDRTDTDRKEDHTPNVIAIMSESFWDAERLENVTFSEELLPNYNRLKEESAYGELFTHVISGGTVVTEFEFLTGFSGQFFPEDYMVYGTFLDEDFSSAVDLFEEQGYQTLAIHPYIATNYNRKNAYTQLGFDHLLFEQDFTDPKLVRNYISDDSVVERIIEEYEKSKSEDRPQFIFTVTMQNHGGYWKYTIDEENVIPFTTEEYGPVAFDCMTDYFSGLHSADAALGKLVDHFRSIEEDTIIIFFGDHMSDAGPKDDRMLNVQSWGEDPLEYDYETHRVPFLVWSNIQTESEDWGMMEAGDLLPTVFEEYEIPGNTFWQFLAYGKNSYRASDDLLFVDEDGTWKALDEMSEEQKKYFEELRLLQYDYIWGDRYALELWKPED